MPSIPPPALAGDRLPTLPGNRLQLRWLTPGDVPAMFDLGSHPEVARYWSSPPMQDPAEAEALLRDIHAQFAAKTLFQWGIERLDDPVLVGSCTLHHLDFDHRHAEVGYSLRREFWGAGLMTEALTLLFDFAFETLDFHRLEADADPRNERSLRLLERLGFLREGYFRERYHVAGEIQDSVMLGLLRRDWRQRAAR
jgi:ribosomal-protein-alanine N-acetyltransferase